MKLVLSKTFHKKSSIKEYPMIGFWAQCMPLTPDQYFFEFNTDVDSIRNQAFNDYVTEGLQFRTNTFVYEDHIKISFSSNLVSGNTGYQRDPYRYLYLFAVDYFEYLKYKSVFDDLNAAAESNAKLVKALMYNHLAGYIDLESVALKKNIPNIISLPLTLRCSLEPLSEENQIQVDHYNAIDIGQSNFYTISSDTILVDYLTGLDRIKDTLTYLDPIDLNGSMTINKSGVIQL